MKKFLVALLLLSMGILGWWLAGRQMPLKKQIPLEDVTLKLKWIHQAQFAGNYVAVEKGFYADEGLRVSLEPFSFEDTTIDSVVSGKSDFGITGADELLLARALGKPVKAIAVIYKTNPVTAFTLKSSGITKPQDFVGKRVGIQKGINTEYLYLSMMSKLKIDRSKIKEVVIGYDAKELLEGKVDVSTGYIINEPQLVVEAGHEVNTILMADYGVNMYADVLFTTDEMIKNKPELVKKLLRGTLRGWQFAIENEEVAVDETLKYATTSTKRHESYVLSTSTPLINTGTSKLGWMEKSQWEQVQDILFEQKLLKQKINISDAFTMEFIQAIY